MKKPVKEFFPPVVPHAYAGEDNKWKKPRDTVLQELGKRCRL
jgi:hypothetical protein